MSAYRLNVPAKRWSVLNGVLFRSDETKAKSVLIAITGIHGNFYSNPFYYNFGETLTSNGIDFVYAQTNDAFNRIETVNVNTGKPEVIGSYNEYSCTLTKILMRIWILLTAKATQTLFLPGTLSERTRLSITCPDITTQKESRTFCF